MIQNKYCSKRFVGARRYILNSNKFNVQKHTVKVIYGRYINNCISEIYCELFMQSAMLLGVTILLYILTINFNYLSYLYF